MSIPFLRKDELAYGAVEEAAPGVRRVLCNNPSAFTFRGTNTWIIGRGRVAVLDPGPEDAAHLAAVLDALRGETVTHILVSHTHRDHSPGARALQAATGAPTHGFGPHLTPPDQGGEGGDHGFTPDLRVPDGGVVEGEDWRLTALHTPGHCGNHLCFAMGGTGAFFSADMVMSWSTSVVSPPDGDMAAYMRSLDRLIARGAEDRRHSRGAGRPGLRPARPAAGAAGGAQPARPPDQAGGGGGGGADAGDLDGGRRGGVAAGVMPAASASHRCRGAARRTRRRDAARWPECVEHSGRWYGPAHRAPPRPCRATDGTPPAPSR